MKKTYSEPEIEIIQVEEDIVTASCPETPRN
jgi:hypothetical protein